MDILDAELQRIRFHIVDLQVCKRWEAARSLAFATYYSLTAENRERQEAQCILQLVISVWPSDLLTQA